MTATHLTLTGVLAGVTLCGAERVAGGTYAHAMYAPTANPRFRAVCCRECLEAWHWTPDDPDEYPDDRRAATYDAAPSGPDACEFGDDEYQHELWRAGL